MKKVLIITYYWPPSGGAGVQRWLKFVKYLRLFGWEPIIYTPENAEMPVIDHSLLKDIPGDLTVLKTKIIEPYNFYKIFVGRKKEEKINTGFLSESKKPKLAEKIAVWIRGNFFIPDARKFWIKPSVRFLSAYFQKNKVDVIISTGPPHSMHLIALGLKKKFDISWLADFRDPWTNIDFYEDLMLTKCADKKHHKLEKEVLVNADAIVTVGETMKKEFMAILKSSDTKLSQHPDPGSRLTVITNGYDEEDVYRGNVELDKKFSISHIGTLVQSRNSNILWKVISEILSEYKSFPNDLEIKFVGKIDFSVNASLKEYGLENYVKKIDYLPHNEVIKFQQQSQVLLLLSNNTKNARGILTGKFFEYLSAKRPILAIGARDGDMAKILEETNAGKISDFNDELALKRNILEYYESYKNGNLVCESKGVEKYSRKELTVRLATLLESFLYFPEGVSKM